jgi:Zn-dependent peptidase ImmA (M78 family)
MTVRTCPQCAGEMEPFFDSTCHDPAAWLCQRCGTVQMDTDLAALSPEAQRDLKTLTAFMGDARPTRTPAVARARARAQGVLETVRGIPVDIHRIAEQNGYPVRERPLPAGERGTIARDGDHTVIVVSRDRLSEAERRWVVAEELGHAMLEHSTLVASTTPGSPPVLAEPRRRTEEREAKAFAAEVLMPEEKVRGRFAQMGPRIQRALGLRQRETETGEVVVTLARMFGVTPSAMRLRLEELDLLR